MAFTHELVSVLMGESRDSQHYNHHDNAQLLGFMTEVELALGAKTRRKTYSSANVYREGDIHELGEIGVKPDGSYFVRTDSITNTRYGNAKWEYNIATARSLQSAMKQVKKHLVPLRMEKNLELTGWDARHLVETSIRTRQSLVRDHCNSLTGDMGWGLEYKTAFWAEVFGMEFVDPHVRVHVAALKQAVADWKSAETARTTIHYVGLHDNFGQLVADTAQVKLENPVSYWGMKTVAATALPEWMQGRIAALQMIKPDTYVDGVGLRLDDKVFYIMGGTTDEE
jgi:hypothetical protein